MMKLLVLACLVSAACAAALEPYNRKDGVQRMTKQQWEDALRAIARADEEDAHLSFVSHNKKVKII